MLKFPSIKLLTVCLLLCMNIELTRSEFAKTFAYLSTNVSATEYTNNLPLKEDPGTCECDLTSNSWDAYWCWDWDWKSLKSTWEDAGYCKDKPQKVALPLHNWLDNDQIKNFNVDKGEFSYAGPLTRLFCIYYNNYPPTDTFYDTKSSVSNDEANELDSSEVTFATKLFTTVSSVTSSYYSIFDPLKALYTVNSQTSTMYFPIPKPNFSGMCNYNKPAIFLQEEESVCVGELTMDQATCEGQMFNPKYYYSPIVQLLSDPSSTSSVLTVDTSSSTHYLIDTDGSYATTTTLTSSFTSGSPSTCSNHVKEVYYTFSYLEDSDGNIAPTGVSAQFILQNTQSDVATNIVQKFYSSFELTLKSGEIYSEGCNPGYNYLDQLLTGTVNANTAIDAPIDGFMMMPSTGECLTATAAANTVQTDADITLNFGQNFTTTCSITATDNTDTQFQSLCTGTDMTTLYIYDHLNDLTRIGKFKNSNVNYPSDWITVNQLDLNYGTKTYDSTKLSCKLISEVEVQILTSKVGYPDNQYSYVVAARKKGIEREFYYDSFKDEQRIDIKVSFNFVEITEEEGDTNQYKPRKGFKLASSIFYPFGTIDGASSITTQMISALWGIVLVINLLLN